MDPDVALERLGALAGRLETARDALDPKREAVAWQLAQRRAGDARRTHEALTWRRREHPDWTLAELLDGGDDAADLRLPDELE